LQSFTAAAPQLVGELPKGLRGPSVICDNPHLENSAV
jgi:hypothetical protein